MLCTLEVIEVLHLRHTFAYLENSTKTDAKGNFNDVNLAAQAARTANPETYYEELEFELNDGDKGNFLSGRQCENLFISSFFEAVRTRFESLDYQDTLTLTSTSILQTR